MESKRIDPTLLDAAVEKMGKIVDEMGGGEKGKLKKAVQFTLSTALQSAPGSGRLDWLLAGFVVNLADLVTEDAAEKWQAVNGLRAFAKAIDEAAYALDASPDTDRP